MFSGHAAPDVHHHRQADEGEREREPHPAAHVLLEDEARPERDEQRRRVLDEEADADLEPGDGREVEELDERDAADAEHGEEGELAARRAQARGARQQHDEAEPDERAGAARLREAQRRDAGLEHDLRDRAVDGEQHRGAHDHEVADRRPARGADALGGEVRRVDHRRRP